MEGEKVTIIKKIKKGGHGGHHGGQWKVAYADFVTAMMAFFLLMWILVAMKDKPEVKEGIAEYFKEYDVTKGEKDIKEKIERRIRIVFGDKAGGGEGILQGGSGIQEEQALMKVLKSDIETNLSEIKDQVLIDIFEGAVRVQLVDLEGSQMFPSGSAELTPVARKILQNIAEKLKGSQTKIAIEGHTDAYIYTAQGLTNWELSTMRASAARQELEKLGISAERIIKVSGYAATMPLIGDNPYDARNRRISILIYYH